LIPVPGEFDFRFRLLQWRDFELAATRAKKNLKNAMAFYDYIEIQPPENYSWLVNMGELDQDRLMRW
jgi:DNA polymerase III alpha subunit (gram-positive type)